MRNTGEYQYRECDVCWNSYGSNNEFAAEGWITIHAENTIVQQIIANRTFSSQLEAEDDFKRRANTWIDEQIDIVKRFQPL